MKILYRIIVVLLIAAGCFLLLRYPVVAPAEEILSTYGNPVREEVPEYPGGIARGELSENQQILYDAICEAAENTIGQFTVRITNFTSYDIERALFSVLDDKPEYFWVDYSSCSYVTDDAGATLNLGYLYTGDTLKSMRAEIDTKLTEITTLMLAGNYSTDYEKAVFFHDYIAMNCVYDKSQQQPNIHNAYGALVSNVSVCDGYAHALQLLLNRVGIECHYVPGEANAPDGIEGHAWNLAKLDGVYSYIDLTWNDMDNAMFEQYDELYDVGPDIVSHTYFGLSDAQMEETHTADEHFQYTLPEALANGWFEFFGLAGDSADAVIDPAANALIANIDRSTPYVELKITDKAAFYAFTDGYEGGIDRIVEAANELLEQLERSERFAPSATVCITSVEDGTVLLLFQFAEDED